MFNNKKITDNKIYNKLSDMPNYSKEKIGKTFFYIKIDNYMSTGKSVYISCNKKQYFDNRNINREFEQREFSYNTKIKNKCITIELENVDSLYSQFINDNNLSLEEIIDKKLTLEKIQELINTRDEIDQLIYKCLLIGIDTDKEISLIVNKSRSSVQDRRNKLIKWLSKKLTKF